MAEPAATGFTPAPVTTVTAPTPISADFHAAPPFDVIELLPAAAADRLRLLRQRDAIAWGHRCCCISW